MTREEWRGRLAYRLTHYAEVRTVVHPKYGEQQRYVVVCGSRDTNRRVYSPKHATCPKCWEWIQERHPGLRFSYKLPPCTRNVKSAIDPSVLLNCGMPVQRYLDQFRDLENARVKQWQSRLGIECNVPMRPPAEGELEQKERSILLYTSIKLPPKEVVPAAALRPKKQRT